MIDPDEIGKPIEQGIEALQEAVLTAPPLVPPEEEAAFWDAVRAIAEEAGHVYRGARVYTEARLGATSGLFYRVEVAVDDGRPEHRANAIGPDARTILRRLRHLMPLRELVVNLRDFGAGGKKPRPWGPFDLPDDVARVDRGSIYGNPYVVGEPYTIAEALLLYSGWLDMRIGEHPGFLEPLRGKRLACWCKPPEGFQGRRMCHAQIVAGRLYDVDPETVR